jgi:hypothetical protein
MKLNRTLVVLTAIACALMMAGVAFADNRVEVKVTSEPLPEGTTCSKGGGFSLEFDKDTQLLVGDQITIDLDYISSTNNAQLCRSIDIEISMGGFETGWTAAAIMANDSSGPVYYKDDSSAPDGDLVVAGTVYFRVWGNQGGQRITLDVLGTVGGSITVGNETDDTLVLNFLDQKVNGTHFVTDGIYVDRTVPKDGVYESGAVVLENTLCLDVATGNFQNATVNGNMDSEDDKFTFIPSNPQIAHIAAPVQANQFQLRTCKQTVGTIEPGGVQQAACLFDYERETGYCPDHIGDHRVIIESMYQVWSDAYDYTVTLEILVNGASGDNGVYFTAENIGLASSHDYELEICPDVFGTAGDDIAVPSFAATCQAGTNCAATGIDCSEVNHTRITSATSPGNVGTIDDTQDRFLWIDIPMMAYNYDITNDPAFAVQEGDQVTVRVTLGASNPGANVCGTDQFTVGPYDINVGTFGACGQNFSLVYPYFTDYNSTGWWSGIAVVNMSDQLGTGATAYVFEDDGDEAEITLPDIEGNEMWVGLTTDLFDLAANSDDLGDDRAYVIICADFNIDGFAMIGNNETGEGQGYLPRQPGACPIQD